MGELARVEARLAAIEARTAQLAADADLHRRACEQAEEAERPLVARVQRAEAVQQAAQADLAAAQDDHRAADADRHVWSARAEALALALDQRGSDARWRELDGAVGALSDLVEVDEGWSAAFEAAVGEALNAVIVDGTVSARRVLAAISTGGDIGAVLAVTAERTGVSSGSALRSHVRSNEPVVEQLLDALLSGVIVVDGGWERALDRALFAARRGHRHSRGRSVLGCRMATRRGTVSGHRRGARRGPQPSGGGRGSRDDRRIEGRGVDACGRGRLPRTGADRERARRERCPAQRCGRRARARASRAA